MNETTMEIEIKLACSSGIHFESVRAAEYSIKYLSAILDYEKRRGLGRVENGNVKCPNLYVLQIQDGS